MLITNNFFFCIGTTLTQEMVYLIQTLDFETANTVHLDARFRKQSFMTKGFLTSKVINLHSFKCNVNELCV